MEQVETKEQKKLYRSKTDRMIAGICGGLGEYMNVDSTVIRLIGVLVVLCTGLFPGVLAYIICAFVIPEAKSSVSA
jgi:phage shock protein PspC (stress-responsive transcriptional regulator)